MNDELRRRFPDMTPIQSAPGLSSINGIGTTIVGQRDHDAETGTYVKTHCFCVLFVPLIALGAYRVADAERGWYFIGRVPLSKFARRWNLALLLICIAAAGGIGWTVHTNSPEYQAGRKIDEADRLAAAGQHGKAAGIYRDVLTGPTPKAAADARGKLAALFDDPGPPADQAPEVFRVALDLGRRNQSPVPDLYDRGVRLAQSRAADDPSAALDLLETVSPLAPKPADILALRRELLEKLVASRPTDPAAASRLAVVYEATGQRDKCEALLVPHETQLGVLEGAAVLGRIYAERGKFDRAVTLLKPYVDAKLPALRTAESRLQAAGDGAEKRVIEHLKSGHAPGFDYQAHKRAPQAQQGVLVNNFVEAALKDDPEIRDARQAMVAAAGVVPAALDLGMVQLQRGQQATDPAVREANLKAAEQTFLSVRGFAQQSDTYRLSLGQVYYWLGKHADGKKQFDDLLAARGRTTETLLLVSGVLREVGAVTDARAISEEAYNKEPDIQKKYLAARHRALLFTELDDEITWLSRSDPSDSSVKASLASTKGHKAAQSGQTTDAVAHFKTAIGVYADQPETASTLNNSALCHFDVYHLTGDIAEFTRGTEKLDRAIALLPSDTILLHNAANVVLDGAIRDTAGAALNMTALKRQAGWHVLPFLYADSEGRKALAKKLAAHPGLVKARAYYEKLMVLAPRGGDAYEQLDTMHTWTKDVAALRAVADRVDKADLDLSHQNQEYRDYLAGKKDAKLLSDLKQGADRARETMAATAGKKDATYAVAVADYVRCRSTAALFGQAVDADELVTLAEQADAAGKSEGSATTLRQTLALRAHLRLIRTVPEYGRVATPAVTRLLGLIVPDLILFEGGPLAAQIGADPDMRRRRELLRAAVTAGVEDFGPASWALLVGWNDPAAGRIAERNRADEIDLLSRRIERKTTPESVSARLKEYLAQRMAGRTELADAERKAMTAAGVPAPYIAPAKAP
ncbi:tetratricopeptide repeat protein [Fimbriiglobus ruber]|uniref:Tetratricopeptide repeat protein n=1 Tax=Fimbriiglobus ruber TaxID=1908690 RepID=A0A225EER3_9BACT|nr:hypothetical protein [Fimbriiglobus ruber]OWK46845.1 hypothetical protein FRUB_00544 [Fimbriiglobus ruber]